MIKSFGVVCLAGSLRVLQWCIGIYPLKSGHFCQVFSPFDELLLKSNPFIRSSLFMTESETTSELSTAS
jgi:hypothetical protein